MRRRKPLPSPFKGNFRSFVCVDLRVSADLVSPRILSEHPASFAGCDAFEFDEVGSTQEDGRVFVWPPPMKSFELPTVLVDAVIDAALREDLAAGDVTTEACIDSDAKAVAHAVARSPIVVCGGDVFARVFRRVDSNVEVEIRAADGARAGENTSLWTVRGRARSLLMGERVALNLSQRMSGIATLTRKYVDAVPLECKTRITDTRKTTPGLRALERYAVRVGGGFNHRDHLGSAVLIKDNHIAACGGVAQAIQRAQQNASHMCKIECEVDSLDQLEEALSAGADVVLLDNMDTKTVAEAVKRNRGRAVLEASGGITLTRITELARAGVDAISSGALTHSAPAADIGLDFEASR